LREPFEQMTEGTGLSKRILSLLLELKCVWWNWLPRWRETSGSSPRDEMRAVFLMIPDTLEKLSFHLQSNTVLER